MPKLSREQLMGCNFNKPCRFNMILANEFGVHEAVLLEHIIFWIKLNKKNGKNFNDGHYWTYSSVRELQEKYFPFLSSSQINTVITNLKRDKIIKIGSYNKKGFDRTAWYSIDEKNLNSRLQLYELDLSKLANGFTEDQYTIPYNKQTNRSNTNIIKKKKLVPINKVSIVDKLYNECKDIFLFQNNRLPKGYSFDQTEVKALSSVIDKIGSSYLFQSKEFIDCVAKEDFIKAYFRIIITYCNPKFTYSLASFKRVYNQLNSDLNKSPTIRVQSELENLTGFKRSTPGRFL